MRIPHFTRITSSILFTPLLLGLLLTGCQPTSDASDNTQTSDVESAAVTENTDSSEKPAWLTGTLDERSIALEKQLGGFDQTMLEAGQRYIELYWAGHDANWEYAEHQLEHLEIAINNGLVRRPNRATSAREFAKAYQPLQAAIENKDQAQFTTAFETLTTSCNTCHVTEEAAFAHIAIPTFRLSPVQRPPTP